MQQEPTALRMPDAGIRELFSESQRFQSWLDVEVALAQAQAELDVIPADAAEEITRKARIELLDMDAIYEGLATTGHGLVPLIWELDRVCDGDAGGHVHWGATTQNITQTGKLIQLRKAHRIYLSQLARILEMLADLAESTRDFALPGRTHGQHAVPATFGLKVAVWIDELIRHVERLQGCEDRVFVAMLGGGAGTLGSLGEIGMDIQELMAEKLDMRPMSMPSRTTADHLCEYVVLLGMLSATCSKIGREVYTLMKQEFGELEEPVPPGTVGSSTMPQKRNPKVSQDIVAASRAGQGARTARTRIDDDRARGRPHHQRHDGQGAQSVRDCRRRHTPVHDRAVQRPAGLPREDAPESRPVRWADYVRSTDVGTGSSDWTAARPRRDLRCRTGVSN